MTLFFRVFVALALFASPLTLLSQNLRDTLGRTQKADTIILIDAVTVDAYQLSGGLRTIPGSIAVLVGDGLKQSDGLSFATPLNTLPGVTMQSGTYATSRIVIRGMGSRTPYNTNRIKAYLNDIPITSSDGISTPEEIDLYSLGRIEVVKGPASALYGSGLGGSINLYTPTSRSSEGNVLMQYGAFQTMYANANGNLQSNNTSIWAGLSHIQSNGYRDNNNYSRTSILSAAQWLGQNWDVSTALHLVDLEAGIPSSLGKTMFNESPQLAAPNWNAIGGFKEYQKGLLGVTITGRLAEQLINRLTLFGSLVDSYERRPFNNLNDYSAGVGIRNKLSFHTSKTDWVLGTELTTDSYHWELDIDETLLNRNRENRNQINIFGLAHHRFKDNLTISFALAANHISYRLTDLYLADGDRSGSRNFPLIISPRIGLNYTPNNLLAIYASAGHGFSLPSPEETLLPEGDVNPSIKPEQGVQVEVGSRFTSRNQRFNFDFTLYWIELNDLILTKRLTEDIFTGINAGKSRHQGIELLATSRLLNSAGFPGKLSSTLSYYQSINRFIDFTDDGITHDGNHLPGIPSRSVQLQISWEPAGYIAIDIHLQHLGKQYLNDENTLESAAYSLGNIRLRMPLSLRKNAKLAVYAGLNNFTNSHYAAMVIPNAIGFGGNEPRYYYPGLPRHWYAGVQLGF
ncbi:TonB-dependent receptor [Perlabentimonas gracilis]|uniref:TonB-dependent receptor n=1 Tax=Perlabentimonas gracilis TaxID=2715279 RepID=UPI00140AB66E|nr:TonB-dependent receptor [Perlabentimonas gracilis]NHB67945.1 TonB-dependent receptor [Perlabentimonas gracilis]